MSNWTSDQALAHHGIKGQKWGIRRFQNEDGSLTPAGEERYGVDGDSIGKDATPTEKQKGKIRQKLETNYYNYFKKYGLSDEEARKAAEDRYELTKKVAIGAGIAVGTVAVIAAARYVGRNWIDETIKSGRMLQNISSNSDIVNSGHAFYTSHRKLDNIQYRGMLGDVTGRSNVNFIRAKKDVKIASTRSAKKIYDNLRKTDSNLPKDYREFNKYTIMSRRSKDVAQKEKFFKALKDAGYSGVHDWNDRNNGINSKANIMFDNASFKLSSSTKLTGKEVDRDHAIAVAVQYANKYITPKYVAKGSAILTLMSTFHFDNKVIRESRRKRANEQTSNDNKGQNVGENSPNKKRKAS